MSETKWVEVGGEWLLLVSVWVPGAATCNGRWEWFIAATMEAP